MYNELGLINGPTEFNDYSVSWRFKKGNTREKDLLFTQFIKMDDCYYTWSPREDYSLKTG